MRWRTGGRENRAVFSGVTARAEHGGRARPSISGGKGGGHGPKHNKKYVRPLFHGRADCVLLVVSHPSVGVGTIGFSQEGGSSQARWEGTFPSNRPSARSARVEPRRAAFIRFHMVHTCKQPKTTCGAEGGGKVSVGPPDGLFSPERPGSNHHRRGP